jgi:hypothetical protein
MPVVEGFPVGGIERLLVILYAEDDDFHVYLQFREQKPTI